MVIRQRPISLLARTTNELTHRSDDIGACSLCVGMEKNRDLRGIQNITTKIELPAFSLDKSSMLAKTQQFLFYFMLCLDENQLALFSIDMEEFLTADIKMHSLNAS